MSSINPKPALLIVDDQVEITNSIKLILSKNYDVYTANSVSELNLKLEEREYAVIILDYDLGEDEDDGVTLSNVIYSLNPFSRIILLTGNLEYSTIKRALNEGNISHFINKPLEPNELKSQVDDAYSSFKERIEVTNILKNPEDIGKIKKFVTDIFAPTTSESVKLLGVFIAVDTIPIFSKMNPEFIARSETEQLSDNEYTTLFSSFLSALVTMGLEAFSDKEGQQLSGFKLQSYHFIFRFRENYQFTYLFHSLDDLDLGNLNNQIENLHRKIDLKIVELKPTRYKVVVDTDLSEFIGSYFSTTKFV